MISDRSIETGVLPYRYLHFESALNTSLIDCFMSPGMQTAKLLDTLPNLRPVHRSQRHPSYPYTPLHGISPVRQDPLWLVQLLVPISNIRHIKAKSTTMLPVALAITATAGGFPLLPTDVMRMS